jgi:hypothetical protein
MAVRVKNNKPAILVAIVFLVISLIALVVALLPFLVATKTNTG